MRLQERKYAKTIGKPTVLQGLRVRKRASDAASSAGLDPGGTFLEGIMVGSRTDFASLRECGRIVSASRIPPRPIRRLEASSGRPSSHKDEAQDEEMFRDGPSVAQDGPKVAQESAKMAQDGPKMTQCSHMMAEDGV